MVEVERKMDILELTIKYVFYLCNSKKYNTQMLALREMFNTNSIEELKVIIDVDVNEFILKNKLIITKDFVLKSDSFTPRNMLLISPLYYLYYSKLVFEIAYGYRNAINEVDFSNENMDIFYSGNLVFTNRKQLIKENSTFNKSYNKFRYKRQQYLEKYVLKIDLKDFFNTIDVEILLKKLRGHSNRNNLVDTLEIFLDYCQIRSLPQFHNSIASSLLSQIYLREFDEKCNEYLKSYNINLIRFVDDMYLVKLNGEFRENEKNEILDTLATFLWRDNLILNMQKTCLLTPEDNERDHLIEEISIDDIQLYRNETKIKNKAKSVIDSNDFLDFILTLQSISISKGIDFQEYTRLINEKIAINNEDSTKVLNLIIYRGYWKRLGKKSLKSIIRNWKFIFFNPAQFTVLFIMINNYLYGKNSRKMRRLINFLYKKEIMKYRESLVSVICILQNQNNVQELIDKMSYINADYVLFMNTYI
ncbi:RNA-directed DNA polymerase [Lysinibacillus sp. 54212]|uniref:RNA-directed DNA polymerase n=1 Tax=Lysinibacillus sp. 54212 TaxID=3119829 RepID=UPI002FC584D7